MTLGLDPDVQSSFLRTICRDHIVSTTVSLMTLDHEPLGLVAGQVTSGQVNVDAKAQVTRQAQLTIADPGHAARVDYDDGQPRLNRMIRIHRNAWVEAIKDWVSVPIFTGPITSTSRSDDGTVTIEALSKEHLAIGPTQQPRTFAKGLNRVNVIEKIMRELAGETKFRLPKGWNARLAKPISMSKTSSAWSHATIIARSMGAQLYYDAWGWLRLRKVPVRPAWTFKDDTGGMVISPPVVSESSADLVNKVVVIGAVPKGKKKPLVGTAVLPPYHRYSAQSLKRGGRNKVYLEQIDDDTLRTQKDVDDAAKRRIDRVQIAEREVSFTALPMPLLEPGDIIIVDTEGTNATAPLTQWSIPIGHDGVSTMGYISKVSKPKKKTTAKKR